VGDHEEYLEYDDANGVIKCPYQVMQTSKFRYCQQEKCRNGLRMRKCGDKYNYCRTDELEDEVLSALMGKVDETLK
jgi:hypothetical protein